MEVFKEILRYANIYSITLFVYTFLVCLKQEKRKLFFVRLIPVIAVCVFLSSDIFRNFFDMDSTTIQAYINLAVRNSVVGCRTIGLVLF